jgi:GT2 family glycosyltransferase
MISIIICSRKSDISIELKRNIAETIGCEFELVVIDNSCNQLSIFQAYNEGVQRANGDILCFMHDDIVFQTNNWGVIESIFEDNTIGVVGFGGAHFLSSAPMYWSSSPFISEFCRHNDKGRIYDCIAEDYFIGTLADVVAVDGFCFFMPKKIFDSVRFDDATYNGFHAYDMDICMQVLKAGYRVCVNREVMIMHYWSETEMYKKIGSDLLDNNMRLFADKWQNELPRVIGVSLPKVVVARLNNLFIAAYDAKKVRQSKAYRLGKFLLKPFSWLKSK